VSMRSRKLAKRLRNNKEFRDGFVSAQLSVGLPLQIKALRKQMGWSQVRLAAESGMAQPTISAMENAGHEGFALSSLKKIASAFDVGLVVRFVPYGDLVHWNSEFSPDTFSVPTAKDDPVLNEVSEAIAIADMSSVVTDIRKYALGQNTDISNDALSSGMYTESNSTRATAASMANYKVAGNP
jgi:transcriptional regulator with XRE-family HTH domain